MKVQCPCCKGTGELEDAPGVKLTPVQTRIYEIVSRVRLSGRELADMLYSGDPDGGPENALATIYVQINLMNKQLARAGKKIVSTSRGAGSTYRIVDVV